MPMGDMPMHQGDDRYEVRHDSYDTAQSQVHDVDPRALDQVEAEILRLSGEMNQKTTALIEASQQWAEAEHWYRVEYAKALLRAKGTIPEKEARATLDSQAELADRLRTEAVMKASQEAGRNLRSQLDALRSINANARAASTLARGEGG